MFIEKDGNLYQGDIQLGDRKATKEEIQAFQDKQELSNKINEALAYLSSTDYKMTIDYFATLSKEIQDELILKRSETRAFIRASK